MKLKTLKDIDLSCFACNWEYCINEKKQKIKEEAIKWVKELRRKTSTTGKLDYRLSFKEFFNISEEDLK